MTERPSPQIDANAVRYFTTCLFGAVEADSRLVLSRIVPGESKEQWLSTWVDPHDIDSIIAWQKRYQDNPKTYFSVGLRDPAAYVNQYKRGGIAQTTAMVAFWADIDIKGGKHEQELLPSTKEEALELIYSAMKIPKLGLIEPSIINDTGGGLHVFWLFKEPYIITNEADRERIIDLSDRLSMYLVEKGKERGWKFDNLSDLARVLRLPGTMNKYGGQVQIIRDTGARWALDAFNWLPSMPEIPRGEGTNLNNLDIVQVAEHYGAELSVKSQYELVGGHPHHGSSTGTNLNINTGKGAWRCWRDHSGGDALNFIAVCEGLLDCEKSKKGALTGKLYIDVVKIANEKFGAGIELKGKGDGRTNNKIPLSDTYNADRLVRTYSDGIRHCGEWGKWLVYDSEAGIWRQDHNLVVVEYAKSIALEMVAEANDLVAKVQSEIDALTDDADREEVKALQVRLAQAESYGKHGIKSLGANRLQSMVNLARSQSPVPVSHADLDRYPMLLPAQNGVIDLETGKLLPHDPAYLFSRGISVPYDPEAKCPTWERAIHEMMGRPLGPDSPDDPTAELEERARLTQRACELVTFLKRAFGYSLTGMVSEKMLCILWGGGDNGKSLLISTLLAMLGDYGMKASTELFMAKQSESHPTERAELFGRRFVATTESGKGRRLDTTFIKEATGNDILRVRRMREDTWEFKPTHHIFMATNPLPIVQEDTEAMWTRIRLIPFEVTFHDPDKASRAILDNPRIPKQDKKLDKKLLAELPGILAWCVQGCLDWQKYGLTLPDTVKVATNTYRKEENNVEAFVEEGCTQTAMGHTRAKAMFDAYVEWCEENEQRAVSQKDFGPALIKLGIKRTTVQGRRVYHNIIPKSAPSGAEIR